MPRASLEEITDRQKNPKGQIKASRSIGAARPPLSFWGAGKDIPVDTTSQIRSYSTQGMGPPLNSLQSILWRRRGSQFHQFRYESFISRLIPAFRRDRLGKLPVIPSSLLFRQGILVFRPHRRPSITRWKKIRPGRVIIGYIFQEPEIRGTRPIDERPSRVRNPGSVFVGHHFPGDEP